LPRGQAHHSSEQSLLIEEISTHGEEPPVRTNSESGRATPGSSLSPLGSF
jgi:hypothetical protein